MLLGVISDTHGLLRPEALEALRGSEHILHAGDVGDPAILEALLEIAPVTAIRGNTDEDGPCSGLPPSEAVEFGGKLFYMLHSLQDLDVNAAKAGIDCVITGRTHKPSAVTREGVLYLNPGSAGPRRFSLPVTVARVTISGNSIEAAIVPLL